MTDHTIDIRTSRRGRRIVRLDGGDFYTGTLLAKPGSPYTTALVAAVEPLLFLRDGPGDGERPDGAICWDESGPGGGAWIVRGADVPDGWRRWQVAAFAPLTVGEASEGAIYWTLPLAEPTTERVPWWEAFNSGAHVVGLGGRIESVCRSWGQVRLRGDDGQRVHVDPDGTVEVIVGTEVGDGTVEALTEDGGQ